METANKRGARYPLGGTRHMQPCAVSNCSAEGKFKAPKSPNNIRDYYWFCLEHVREYNANWNFCEGMKQDDIDQMIKSDLQWGRPTWPLGQNGVRAKEATSKQSQNDSGHKNTSAGQQTKFNDRAQRAWFSGRVFDPFDIYEENIGSTGSTQQRSSFGTSYNTGKAGAEQARQIQLKQEEIQAYQTLGFDFPADEAQVKKQYKMLAKDLHPDLNQNDFKAGERLKEVNNAYSLLKKTFSQM